MNSAKYTMALVGAFSLSASIAKAQITYLTFSDIKNYRQVGPEDFNFELGSWDVNVRDGGAVFVGCLGNGGIFPMFPSVPACPLGTTALVVAGDLDGDGVRDGGTFWSIASIIPATIFAPFQEGKLSFEAGPASDLERPLGGYRDTSVSLFYDYINSPETLDRYDITFYGFSRTYGPNELDVQIAEIVPGVYQFRLPKAGVDFNDPNIDPYTSVNVTHLEMIEAYPGVSFVPLGNEFRATNDDAWRGEVMELDPRVSFNFTWEGFNGQTVLGTDRTYFSIKERATDTTLFPPYSREIDPFTGDYFLPEGFRFPQEIPSPSSQFEVGAHFFGTGDQVYVEIEFRRNSQSTGLTLDRSQRFFRWDVNYIDSYEGFRISGNFPGRTSESLTAADADYDGDGMTNLEEFALQTDPADPASVLVPTPVLDPNTGQCILTIPKRPSAGSSLTYQFEYSFDLVTWTLVEDGDPFWVTQNDEIDIYRVRSRFSSPPTSCMTRVRISN